jgi:hypothetical protein
VTARQPAAVAPVRRGLLGVLAPSPEPAGAERPDLRVVGRVRRRRWQVGTVAGIILFAALFAVAGFQTLIVSQQKRLDDLGARIAAETDAGQRLDDDLALLQSPQRITTEATERLGMVAPPGVAYLQPRDDDDARAGEVPAATPPTTAPPATTAPKTSTTAPKASTTAPKTSTTAPKTTTTAPTTTTRVPSTAGGPGR